MPSATAGEYYFLGFSTKLCRTVDETTGWMKSKRLHQSNPTKPRSFDVQQISAIVREYVFTFFFKSKKRDFLRFFEVAFQKNVKNVIQNIQVSECVQHYIKIVDSCI